jgi:hypothetical protein
MRTIPSAALWITLLAFAHPAAAQTQPPAPVKQPDCSAAEYRQLDFWVGEWNVTMGGRQAGTSRITAEESGCVIHEHWTGGQGGTGQSFNFYNRQTGKWRQVWVASNGSSLDFSGTLVDGSLAYTGETTTPAGGRVLHKLTFTPNADGTVRQFWETSADEGATWKVAFDGRYARK